MGVEGISVTVGSVQGLLSCDMGKEECKRWIDPMEATQLWTNWRPFGRQRGSTTEKVERCWKPSVGIERLP